MCVCVCCVGGMLHVDEYCPQDFGCFKTVWPSGLRRWLKAPVRKGVGSNPTAVNVWKVTKDVGDCQLFLLIELHCQNVFRQFTTHTSLALGLQQCN